MCIAQPDKWWILSDSWMDWCVLLNQTSGGFCQTVGWTGVYCSTRQVVDFVRQLGGLVCIAQPDKWWILSDSWMDWCVLLNQTGGGFCQTGVCCSTRQVVDCIWTGVNCSGLGRPGGGLRTDRCVLLSQTGGGLRVDSCVDC